MRTTRINLRRPARRLTRLGLALACAAAAALSLASLPGWSAGAQQAEPDKILFERGLDIYSMNADGSGETRLTMYGLDPAYSPDGTKIVYRCGDNDQNNSICVMNADGTDPRALTQNSDDFDPVWSPDGTRIAFTRIAPGGSLIYVMNADGTDQAPLFGDVSAASEQHSPAWSPDGTLIAYSEGNDFGGVRTIYVRHADGSAPARAVTNTGTDDNPSFSPDGTRIVYDTGNSIRVAPADPPLDERGNRVIPTEPFYAGGDYNLDPAYSPDGTRIAFSSSTGWRRTSTSRTARPRRARAACSRSARATPRSASAGTSWSGSRARPSPSASSSSTPNTRGSNTTCASSPAPTGRERAAGDGRKGAPRPAARAAKEGGAASTGGSPLIRL